MEDDYARDVMGQTASGEYGLPYLLDALTAHRLNAVFFVESLHASALGGKLLQRTRARRAPPTRTFSSTSIPNGLAEMTSIDLPSPYRQNLGDFNLADQTRIVREALATAAAGGPAWWRCAPEPGRQRRHRVRCQSGGTGMDFSFDLREPARPNTRLTMGRDAGQARRAPVRPYRWLVSRTIPATSGTCNSRRCRLLNSSMRCSAPNGSSGRTL
jgi:hypothetical protein